MPKVDNGTRARNGKGYPTIARERIKVGMLLKKLQDHVRGEAEMTPTQIKAAEILLKKRLPDLKAIELTGENGEAMQVRFKFDFGAAVDSIT